MRAGSSLLAASAFLTRVPVGGASYDIGAGAALFPVVGAGVGAAVGGTAYGLAHVVPALVAAGAALAVGALLTGALHLDGLADTADALGARSREAALAIMRDHAIGTYGTVALVLDLLVKAAALAALAGRSRVVLEALAAGALSRAVPVVLGLLLPDVRRDGAGAAFRVTPRAAVLAVVLAAALAIPADPLLIAVAAGAALLLGAWSRRRFGGRTGDTLGAATELAETAVLVAAAALA
jgi:adenosylcobinamide-GDP ribazoletransferase